MERKLRIGVIGVGQIGKVHMANYQKINETLADKIGGVEVAAICDIDTPEAERVAGVHQVKDIYYDFRDLLAREDIEAVDVCLHNNLHMPVTVAALEAGKHVYCEKPMAGAYRDALTMYQTAQAKGLKLSIQLNTLFANETRAAKAVIDAGLLGQIYHARSTGFRRRGRPYVDGYGTFNFVKKEIAAGGALYDMGVYHIAAMLYLIGNPEVLRVSGKTYQELDMDPARREISGYNVEELGLGFVRFTGGLTMDLIEAWAVNLDKFDGSTIFGNKGGLRLDPFGYFNSAGDLDFNAGADMDGFEWRLHTLRANAYAYDFTQAHWVAALHERVPLLPCAALALNTMLISEGIYLSDRLGREVSAAEILEHSQSSAISPIPPAR